MSKPQKIENFSQTLKKSIWILGTSSWVFGIRDRSLASLADGYISAIDIIQLCTASFFFF
jgi:hypothetical protein